MLGSNSVRRLCTLMVYSALIFFAGTAPAIDYTYAPDPLASAATKSDWGHAKNWTPEGVPGAADTATIASHSTTFVLSTNVPSTLRGLTVDGFVTIVPTNLTITESFNWIEAELKTGTVTIASGATLTFSGPSGGVVNRILNGLTLNIAGTANWTGAGTAITLQNGAVINNSGVFDAKNDASINGGGLFNFNNLVGGVVKKSAGSGRTVFTCNLNNAGTVQAESGILTLSGGVSNGTFSSTGSAKILFNGNTHTLNSGAALTGTGFVAVGEGGTLKIPTGVTVGSTNFEVLGGAPGGNVAGGGTLNISQGFHWLGGLTDGEAGGANIINVQASANTFIEGDDVKTLSRRTLNLAGNTIWRGNSGITLTNGALINNSGSFDVQNDRRISGSTTVLSFHNLAGGTVKKSSGTGRTEFVLVFNNDGTLSANSDGLITLGGGTSTGTFTASTALSKILFNGSPHTLNAGANLNGDGTVSVGEGGRLDIATGTTVGATNIEVQGGAPGGTLGGGGTLNISKTFNWLGGLLDGVVGGANVIKVAAGGQTLIKGNDSKTLSRRTLNLEGDTQWKDAGALALSNGGLISNKGIFDVQSDVTLNGSSSTLGFRNLAPGILKKSTGVGRTRFVPLLNNDNIVLCQSGTLALGGGASTGTFSVGSSMFILFNGTPHTLNQGAVLNGNGTVQVGEGGTLTIPTGVTIGATRLTVLGGAPGGNLNGGGTLNISVSLVVQGGLIDGLAGGANVINVASGAQMLINGDDIKTISRRTLNLNGNTIWSNNGALTLSNGAVINNNGVFDIQNDRRLSGNTSALAFFNSTNGVVQKSAGTGLTEFVCQFTNAGTVISKTGTLSLVLYSQTGGKLDMNGGKLSAGDPLALQGGTLLGTGDINGAINNTRATVSPGRSPGFINQTGNYTQSAGGTLRIELEGVTVGTQYDQLKVNGTVNLGGTLSLSVGNGFTSPAGATFIIINNDGTDAVTGTFSNRAEGAVISAGGKSFLISYVGGDGNDVVLTHLPQLTINDVTVTENNSGTTNAVFTVTLSQSSTPAVAVDFSTANGTATAGNEYIAVNNTLIFSSGQTIQTITIPVFGDTLDEDNKTFFVNLSNATNAVITDAQGIGTIADDDATPTLVISNPRAFLEGSASAPGSTSFGVRLSAPSGKTVRVNYQTANGLVNGALADSDYVAANGTLTFNPGQTLKTVTVNFVGDAIAELNETFFVDLKTPINATIADSRGAAYIGNDDGPGIFIDNAKAINEGNSGFTSQQFTVRLSAASTDTITVDFATANNTAGPADFTATSGRLTFTPGETSKVITVLVKGDTTVELTETYRVNLTRPTFAIIADSQGIGYIVNDDVSS